MFDLEDRDPASHYVWAYKGDQASGSDYYLQLGYEPVLWSDGGVRPRGRRGTNGTEIERMGHVLMRISLEERQRIEEEGIDGQGGLRMVRQRQERILKQSNSLLRDMAIRGRDGDAILTVSNQTSNLTELEVDDG